MANEELVTLRKKIDEVDRRLVEVLAERFLITQQVGELKAQRNLPSHDPVREAEKIAALVGMWPLEYPSSDFLVDIFSRVMAESRKNHERLRRELIPMKIFTIGFLNRDILVRVAQKDSDTAELRTLVSQTESLDKISGGKTGLHLVDSFEKEGAFHAMLVLNKGLTFNSKEIEKLRALVLRQKSAVS